MKFQELNSELRTGKLRSVYLFHGPERFLMTTAVDLIRATGEENRFAGGVDGAAKILDLLKTPSMFAARRLAVVDNADKLKKEDWKLLDDYADAPAPNAVLILLAEKASAAWSKKSGPEIAVVECKTPYPREIPSWIQMEGRKFGISFSQQACLILAEAVGTDLGQIIQSIEKLALYAGTRKLIDVADVEAVVAVSASRTVFDMTNAIGNKKPMEAMALIDNLMEQGEFPVKILSMISRHFRLLARAQEGVGKGSNEAVLAKELKVHPFFVKDYVSQSKRFRPRDWPGRFAILYACDRSLKSSKLPPERTLEKTILKLCA